MITFINMLSQMAPYLLLGFLMAGLLHVFVPANFFERHLSKENFKSVLLAGLIGIPLPLCSCSNITEERRSLTRSDSRLHDFNSANRCRLNHRYLFHDGTAFRYSASEPSHLSY